MTWTAEERAAWAPPELLTVSEWADRFRVLPPGTSAEPGPFRTDRAPFLRAIQDAMGDATTQEVTLMKSPQVGGSEATRNAIGRWIDQDPGPCLIVYPSEQAGKEMIDERVVPMLRGTAQLRRYLTPRARDIKLSSIRTTTMSIYTGHAGSPQSLASRPVRYVVCDEVDKYPPFSGREADPVNLAEARTRTYGHRRKVVHVSTPTTKHGLIYQLYEGADVQLVFNVPCPHCATFQELRWERLRWAAGATARHGGPLPETETERVALAGRVEAGQEPVWYECRHCHDRLLPTDRHAALAQGRWVDRAGEPYAPGSCSRVAFHVSSLYSPWVSWSRVVAEFLRSRGTPQAMMNFMNNWLGRPYEEQVNKIDAGELEDKVGAGGPRGLVPGWARFVIATVDTGSRDFWYVVRAHGAGFRSKLLDYGHVYSFTELEQRTLRASFAVAGSARRAHEVDLLLIDTGGTRTDDNQSRTDQVYKWSARDHRVAPIKGEDPKRHDRQPVRPRRVTYRGGNEPYDVTLNLVNVHYYKDVLAKRMFEPYQGVERWQLCTGIGHDYLRQLVAEHKVLIREGRTARLVWRPKTKGLPNHLWDCEVYQGAAADMIRVDLLTEGEQAEPVAVEVVEVTSPAPRRPRRFQQPGRSGYLATRRKKRR